MTKPDPAAVSTWRLSATGRYTTRTEGNDLTVWKVHSQTPPWLWSVRRILSGNQADAGNAETFDAACTAALAATEA